MKTINSFRSKLLALTLALVASVSTFAYEFEYVNDFHVDGFAYKVLPPTMEAPFGNVALIEIADCTEDVVIPGTVTHEGVTYIVTTLGGGATLFTNSAKEIVKSVFIPKKISLFDIMPKLQHDENCFSDALKFFIKRDKDHWVKIFNILCKDNNIGSICSVKREEDATISKKVKDKKQTSPNNENTNNQSKDENNDNKKSTKLKKGGRIDLLIRTKNAYIVIENKIKSGINSKGDDSENENQLDRYKDYVNYCILGALS